MTYENFVSQALDAGGSIHPIIIPAELTNGTGIFNPSIHSVRGKIFCVVRHCQVTIWHSEKNILEHEWGPLVYLHPEDDHTLTTTNYFVEFDPDTLDMKSCSAIDFSKLNTPPRWNFIGLEDCRLIRWNEKTYICGVRRDTEETGIGRMELCEIQSDFDTKTMHEVSRFRMPAPKGDSSYCEKNWMPIEDMPYCFVKWCSETDVVRADPVKKTTEQIVYKDNRHIGFKRDPRGGTQVLPWGTNGGHFCITHEVDLYKSDAGRKDGKYTHRFIFWDKDWNIISMSKDDFTFMNGKIEFAAGMTKHGTDYLISFGYRDNAAFVLRCPQSVIEKVFTDGFV